jgi:hypothetical protein
MFAAFAFQQRCLLLAFFVATNSIFLPDAAIFFKASLASSILLQFYID